MIDFIIVGFIILYVLSAYLRKSVIGAAAFGLYAGLFFNIQYNNSFVDWLANHGLRGSLPFLNALVALVFILLPTVLALHNFKSNRGHFVIRISLSIAMGMLTGFYVGNILASTSTFSSLSTGGLYDLTENFLTTIGVLTMALAVADISMSKPTKSKEDK